MPRRLRRRSPLRPRRGATSTAGPRRHDGVGRQSVVLRLVQQQEERAVAAHPVIRVVSVQPGLADADIVQLLDALLGTCPQFVDRPELDRVGRAGFGARRLETVAQPVVAQRALEHPAVVRPLVDHAVRAGRHAVAAAVADVLLYDDGAELGAEQRAGRAHVQAGGVRAVLAHVRGHQPAHAVVSTR
jgi:hypothetical protein